MAAVVPSSSSSSEGKHAVMPAAVPAACLRACRGCAAGADPSRLPPEFAAKSQPGGKGGPAPGPPVRCSLVEVLLREQAGMSGVADSHMGSSWLHEVVR